MAHFFIRFILAAHARQLWSTIQVLTWIVDHNIWLKSCSIEFHYLAIFPLCYGAKLLTILVYFFNCLIWTVNEIFTLRWRFRHLWHLWCTDGGIAISHTKIVMHGAIKSLLSRNLLLHYNSKLFTTLIHFSISFILELKLPVKCWLLTGDTPVWSPAVYRLNLAWLKLVALQFLLLHCRFKLLTTLMHLL